MHEKNSQLKVLLRYGAEVDCQTFDSEFPLNIAIARNNIEAIQLLLDIGANPTLTTMTNRTILHTAADYASIDTIYVLATANLLGIDPDAKDNDDCTALQLLDLRIKGEKVDQQLRAAFTRLTEMVKQQTDAGFTESAVDEDAPDEFCDALAELSAV